jgi:multidrug efflux pump
VLSQILTLYTTPVIYLWFDRIAQRFGKGRKSEIAVEQETELSPEVATAK